MLIDHSLKRRNLELTDLEFNKLRAVADAESVLEGSHVRPSRVLRNLIHDRWPETAGGHVLPGDTWHLQKKKPQKKRGHKTAKGSKVRPIAV